MMVDQLQSTNQRPRSWPELRLVSMGFHECFMHIKYSATSAKFHFFMKPLGERRKEFHHGETFGHSFTYVGNCVKPH
jgi:hypothetical protein